MDNYHISKEFSKYENNKSLVLLDKDGSVFRLPARMIPVGRADCRLQVADLKMEGIMKLTILANSNLRD